MKQSLDECLWKGKEKAFFKIHPFSFLKQPFEAKIEVRNERVFSSSFQWGWTFKNLERLLEKKTWIQAWPIVSHVDPETPVFAEVAYFLALEDRLGVKVSAYQRAARTLLLELSRMNSWFRYLSRIAWALQWKPLLHFFLVEREKWLDLLEQQSGSRYGQQSIVFQGVRHPVTRGFLGKVQLQCEQWKQTQKDAECFFLKHPFFIERAKDCWVFSKKEVQKWRWTGWFARLVGLYQDVRLETKQLFYHELDSPMLLGWSPPHEVTLYDMAWYVFSEIEQTLEWILKIISVFPSVQMHQWPVDLKIPAGESFTEVESHRGRLGCYVLSLGGVQPTRVQWMVPSSQIVMALPDLLKGQRIENLSLIFTALDLTISEIDR